MNFRFGDTVGKWMFDPGLRLLRGKPKLCAGCGKIVNKCDCALIKLAIEAFIVENPEFATVLQAAEPAKEQGQ